MRALLSKLRLGPSTFPTPGGRRLPAAVCLLLLLLLLVLSHAAPCRAQGGARAPKDEEPLAAALRLARAADEVDKESALGQLFKAHLGAGRLEEAVRAAGALDDGALKALMQCRAAAAFAEAGNLERAAALLSESLRTARSAKDDESGMSDVLGEVVNGELRYDFNDLAPYDVERRKGALARLVEAGRAEAAANVLSQLEELARDPERDPVVAARVLAGAAPLFAKSDAPKSSELLSGALAAARRVEVEGAQVRSLCEVARAYAAAGDSKTAEALLDEARQAAEARGEDSKQELRDVAISYTFAGLDAKALKAMPEPGAGEWDVSSVYVKTAAGRAEDLKESLTRQLARAASLEWESSRARALTDLAIAYGSRDPDLLADVLWAARALGDDSERACALAAVGDSYAKAGRKAAAVDAWSQAYEAARAVKLKRGDFEPRSSVRGDADKLRLLSALAKRFVRAGEYGRATEFARDMRAVEERARALTRGLGVSAREADITIAALAGELVSAGQKEAALAVLAEVQPADLKPGPGTETSDRTEALAAVGAAYAKAGDKARAALYLRRSLQLAETLEDYGQLKFSALVSIGRRYAEAGMRPDARARQSLRRLVTAAEEER